MPPMPRRCTAALFLTLAPLAVLAQEASPYYIGLSQTFGYDDNVFRLPDRTVIQTPEGGTRVIEPESSGLISTTLLLAGLDQPIGRQRLYADLSAGYTAYADQSQLDNPTYNLVAGIDWETIERLSGNLEFSSGRRLGAYGDRDLPTGAGDNDERFNRVAFLARLGDWKSSRVWLEADVVWDQIRNDVEFQQAVPVFTGQGLQFADGYRRDDTATALGLGVRYRVSGATVAGAGLRTESRERTVEQTLIDAEDRAQSQLDSRRNDIDFFLNYQPSDLHELRARLSYGETDYDQSNVEDRTGWSGSLRWIWRPTAKLISNLRLLYDTEDRDFGGASAADGRGDRQTTAAEYQLSYAATDKVSATLGASYYKRDYEQRGLEDFTDRDTLLSLGVNWAALRSTTLGCSIASERRSSSLDTEIGRNSYDALQYSCFVQVVVQ